MTANCILIPVHIPKVNWLHYFLISVQAHSARDDLPFDIVLVASNHEELAFFGRLSTVYPFQENIRVVSAEDIIESHLRSPTLTSYLRDNRNGCVVNLKKFTGLIWAKTQGYEWVACIDSDTAAVRNLDDLFNELIQNYDNAIYPAALTDDDVFTRINSGCAALFDAHSSAAASEITRDLRLYGWFFDCPTYSMRDFSAFVDDMARTHGSFEAFLEKLDWHSFEHTIFVMWRCLRGSASLFDYSAYGVGPTPEFLSFRELIRVIACSKQETSWLPARMYFRQQGLNRVIPSVRLIYHVDRM